MDKVVGFFLVFPLFMAAVTVHELSHGWVAFRLGDLTASRAGRLTLNPLRHIDPLGTVVLPLLLQMVNAPVVFGWAKPVPVNAMNLRHPRRDMLWVGAAGPAANFLFAGLAALGLKLGQGVFPALVLELARYLVLINVVLGVFNLLPIPPLDGSRILASLLPARFAGIMMLLERWGFLIILLLLLMGLDDWVLKPLVEGLARWLGL